MMRLPSILAAMMLLAEQAGAQQAPAVCGPYEKLRDALKERAGQTEISFGMIDDTSVIEIFASPAGEYWTILVVGATGNACVLATGTDWWATQILKGSPV